jgi:hypothetical protein
MSSERLADWQSQLLTKILHMATQLPENAIHAMAAKLPSLDLAFTDLAIVVANGDKPCVDENACLIRDLHRRCGLHARENEQHRAAVAALRRFVVEHHGETVARQFDRPSLLPLWDEFEELAKTRFFDGCLPANWMEIIAPELNVTMTRMRRWRSGSVAVPYAVLDWLMDRPATIVSTPVTAQRVWTREHVVKRVLSDDERIQIATAYFAGRSKSELQMEFGLVKSQTDIDWDRHPPAGIAVSPDGPVDWMQLWKLETSINPDGRNWRQSVILRLQLPEKIQFTDDLNAAVSPRALQALRQSYFVGQAETGKKKESSSPDRAMLTGFTRFLRSIQFD